MLFVDIIFTSGGTEANNLVLNTAVEHFRLMHSTDGDAERSQPHIISSSLEHDSIKLVLDKYRNDGTAGNYICKELIMFMQSVIFTFHTSYTCCLLGEV